MSQCKYYKLVRDKIPEIIASSGKSCEVEILSDEDYLIMLDKKLTEELAEYQKDKTLEELADLFEVMLAIIKAKGWTPEQLEHIRANKANQRGKFEKKILLKTVFD